jgi:hypothetical protein
MRIRAMYAAVLGMTAAAALTLTACGGDTNSNASDQASSSAAAPGAAAPSTSASAPGTGSAVPANNANAGSTTSSSGGSSTTGGGSNTGGKSSSSRCHTSDLKISFATGGDAAPTGGDDQQNTCVMLQNKSSRTCTLQGFPGVDLKGGGTTWSLARSNASATKFSLAPGDSTQFMITFLPWTKDGGTVFKPTSVVVTPPNETTSTTIAWPWGSVLLQDGATHPGTYTGPIGSGPRP